MSCGEGGWQYRVVYCHKVFKDGSKMTVPDEECGEGRPAPSQECNRFACPEWNAGPWSACSKPCGEAKQYRSVTCRSEKAGEEGKLMPATACPAEADARPANQRLCNLGPCTGLDFVIGEWDLCAKCNDTTETRSVKCMVSPSIRLSVQSQPFGPVSGRVGEAVPSGQVRGGGARGLSVVQRDDRVRVPLAHLRLVRLLHQLRTVRSTLYLIFTATSP